MGGESEIGSHRVYSNASSAHKRLKKCIGLAVSTQIPPAENAILPRRERLPKGVNFAR